METDQDYLSILDELPNMIWRSGLDSGCDYFNRGWLEFTGQTIEHELGVGWLEGVHPDDRQRCIASYLTAFANREPFEIEYRLRNHKGVYCWIRDTGRPIRDRQGNFAGFIGSCIDLTEIRQTSQAIQEREKLLTTAALAAPIVFFKIDREGIVQFSLGQSLTRRLENVDPVGTSIYKVFKNVPKVIEGFEKALAGETVTLIIEAADQIYETTYAPLPDDQGEITNVVGVATNVTRHHAVEAALRESEVHFRTVFDDAILGIKLVDFNGRIIESNPALQEMLGYTAEELRQASFLDLTHPKDLLIVRRLYNDLMAGKMEHFRAEKRYLRKDGQTLWGRVAMSLVRDQDGAPQYGIGMIENITAQKLAEAELAEMQRRLIDGAEMERLHLSQELHDGPLQDLQVISMQMAMLEDQVNGPDSAAELENIQEELRTVARSLRSVCGDLRPPALDPFGLEKTIRSHAEHFQEQHRDIHVHINLKADGKELTERVRLVLFRIYQQSMANIFRHAKASNVWIWFDFDDDHITLKIRDDGRGFPVPQRWIELVRGGHFGLVGSIERAESVGGRLEIHSSPGAGTEVLVIVPRSEEEQVAVRERIAANYVE